MQQMYGILSERGYVDEIYLQAVVGSFDTLVEAQRFADRYADDEYSVEESK